MDANLKKCSHCQEEINKDAKKCPKCQSDLRSWGARHPIMTFIFAMIILGGVIQAMQDNGTIANPTSSNVTPQINQKLIDARKNIVIEGYVEKGTIAPSAVLKITNKTPHTIDLFGFTADIFNNADEKQKAQISGDDYFGGQSQELLAPGKTVTWRWQLSLFPHATKIGNIEVIKIHYKDTNETVE